MKTVRSRSASSWSMREAICSCDLFGEDYFPDEGLMDHSLHTAIIDRNGRLVANLEGNEFTAEELGDLVQTVLGKGR